MAKKRNVYKGGAKAAPVESFIRGGSFTASQINFQLARAESTSEKELRQTYSKLRSIAQKRVHRMEGRAEARYTFEHYQTDFPKLKGQSREEVVRNLKKVTDFLSAGRGSLSGIQNINKQISESLEERGYEIPKDQLAKFGSFMNAMKKALGIQRGEYASGQLASLWVELFQKGKISQSRFEKRIKEVMKDMEAEAQENFSRAQRQDVNEILRERPINTFFDDLALDPRTVRAQEARKDYAAENRSSVRRGKTRKRGQRFSKRK